MCAALDTAFLVPRPPPGHLLRAETQSHKRWLPGGLGSPSEAESWLLERWRRRSCSACTATCWLQGLGVARSEDLGVKEKFPDPQQPWVGDRSSSSALPAWRKRTRSPPPRGPVTKPPHFSSSPTIKSISDAGSLPRSIC